MFPAAAVDPATAAYVVGGAFGLIGAATVTGWFSYRAAVRQTKGDRLVSEQAREDTTATAAAFDLTIKALADAAARAVQRADQADHTAQEAKAEAAERHLAEQRCLDAFAAHRQATDVQLAAMKEVMDGLLARTAPGQPTPDQP